METLYRKVQFEIHNKDHDQTVLIGKNANFMFNPNTRNGEELTDFLSGCEEITDTSHQIKKLEAEKKELLEALENSLKVIEWYMENTMPENDNHTDFFNIGMNQRSELESLIKKHKQ